MMKGSASLPYEYRVCAVVFFVAFILLFSIWQDNYIDDVFYYYYLSSLFFDGDVDILNDYFISNNTYLIFDTTFMGIGPKGLLTNYFAMGSAVLWFPFFLVVRIAALIVSSIYPFPLSWVSDRYSYPYRAAISFATLAYGFMTLLMLYELCRMFFKRRISLWAALGAVFASPVPGYIYHFSSMSHALSAFSVTLLIYMTLRHRHFASLKDYIIIGSVGALATLTRWQNLIFFIIPLWFLFPHLMRVYRIDRQRFTRDVRYTVLMLLSMFALFSIQMFYWYAQLGNLLTVPQGKGFLKWLQPHVWNVLFSGWHGLYYCHPLLLFATIGLFLFLLRRRLRYLALVFIICFIGMTYINAIAYDWFAGNSFGARRFSSLVPVFALGMGSFFSCFRKRLTFMPALMVIFAALLNFFYLLFFTRQMFDFYLWHEIWLMRFQLFSIFISFIATVHLNSRIFVALLLENNIFEAVVLTTIGALIISCILIAMRKGWFRYIERRFLSLFLAVLLLIIALDAALFFRPPEPDRVALLFREALQETSSGNQKEEIITALIKYKWINPLFYVYTYRILHRTDLLPEMLDNLKKRSPTLWAKMVHWIPEHHVGPERRRLAQRYKPERVAPSADYIFSKRYEDNKRQGLWNQALYWIDHRRAYRPFDVGILSELIKTYDRVLKNPAEAHSIERFLQEVLEARTANTLAHVDSVEPFDFIVLGGNVEAFKLLGRIYEKNKKFTEAEDFYDVIYSKNRNPYFLEREMVVKATRDILQLEEIADEIMKISTPVDSKTIQDLAALCLEHHKPRTAEKILLKGFGLHPYDKDIQKLYISYLNAYTTDEIPIDTLLQEDIESPMYWTVVAEQLNRLERYAEAFSLMDKKVMTAIPLDVRANFAYGLTLFNMGDDAKAFKYLAYALRWGKEPPEYSLYVARCLVKQGKSEQALAIMKWLLKANPDYEEGIEWLAIIIKQ